MPPVKARTLKGSDVEIAPTALDTFRAGLRGPVLLPGDPGFEDCRTVWNGMIDRHPALVVRPIGTADVMAAVNFARQNDLLLSIKGGGHNISGLAVADGALAIDMGLMRGVWVDTDRRIARAQAGCVLGDVDRETQLHGLAGVMGFVSNTGIAGLTLGGGFGYLTRRFGWTSDTVTSIQMVTADGRLITVNDKENADLFWGLRGGGGNFGVVTSFDYKLFPLGPEIMAGAIAWKGDDTLKVLELFRELTEDGPPELSCALALRLAPPVPWIAPEYHGKFIAALFVCHTGSLADGDKVVAPIKSFLSPIGDVIMKRPYTSQQSILDPTQPKGRRYYWKSEYLPALSPDLFARYVEHGRRITSPFSAAILFPVMGPLAKLPPDHSAVGNRDAAVVLNLTSAWDKPEEDAANIQWARNAWEDMKEFGTGGTYINFLTEEEGDTRIQSAYGQNYRRLAELKAKWDPTNMFRTNKNILPRS